MELTEFMLSASEYDVERTVAVGRGKKKAAEESGAEADGKGDSKIGGARRGGNDDEGAERYS